VAEATVRARIKTILESVSNVGNVYDYERWAADWTTYLDLFKTTISGSQVIRGWTITCQSFRPVELTTIGDQQINREYTYKIRGYFGLDDANASEKAAMLIAEDVCEALDADTTLHGASYYGPGEHPMAELTIFEPRAYGDVLCHYAEITQVVKEEQ
jgi:hypothetical protein